MKINDDLLIDAIKASILNDEYCCKISGEHRNKFYKIKYSFWIISLILFSPPKNIKSKKFICVTTVLNDKILSAYAENNEYFKFGSMNKRLKDIKKNISIFSPYTFFKRVLIICTASKFFFKYKTIFKNHFHNTIEYYSIAFYLIDNCIEQIMSSGMYERYCTFLGYLGRMLKIKVIGIQDGAAINIGAPAKVYCDEMYVFDEFEQNIINSFIENNDCKYTCIGFHSVLEWDTYDSNDKINIAIASQDWFTYKTLEIIDLLMSNLDTNKVNLIVFPHYREKRETYNELYKKYPKLIIEPQKRYRNIDLLITYYSTIVYDFWSVNKNIPVICLHIDGYEPSYYNRENVCVVENVGELEKHLRKFL